MMQPTDDHDFIPQAGSNMCICGLPDQAHTALPVPDPPDELAVESGGGTARRARLAMLHDLERVVAMCGCSWPVTVYRSGDGHHPECPAHKPLVRPTRGTKADGR